MSLTPLSRAQLQAEAVDGNKREQIRQLIQRPYQAVVTAARAGQTEYFFQCPGKMGINVRRGDGISYTSNDTFITHADLVEALQRIFPDVTITAVPQKGAGNVVYQQAGILLEWS
jgi:hypothetical protein